MSVGLSASFDLQAPDDLAERDQWVLWRYEGRDEKRTKVPYALGGVKASSIDLSSWIAFDLAMSEWRKSPDRYTGLGFVFAKNDPFCGIDLDDALDADGNAKPWARGIVERFSDTYTEISPSGCGLKIWARGALPTNLPGVKVGDGQIEMYDHARYFTVTGRVFRDAPREIEDHASDLMHLYAGLTKGKRWKTQPLEGGRIPYGQQHNTLVSIAGTLRKRRVCDEAIEACLQIINEKQCERPGTRNHISKIVQGSRRWSAT